MNRCKDLAIINMQGATRIAKVYKEHRRGIEDKITKMELEMQKYERGMPNQWEQYTLQEEERKQVQGVHKKEKSGHQNTSDKQTIEMMSKKIDNLNKRTKRRRRTSSRRTYTKR